MRAFNDATIQLTAAGEEVTRMEILQKSSVANYLGFKAADGENATEKKAELNDNMKRIAVEVKTLKTKLAQCQLDRRNAEENVTRFREQITTIEDQIAAIANCAENVKT